MTADGLESIAFYVGVRFNLDRFLGKFSYLSWLSRNICIKTKKILKSSTLLLEIVLLVIQQLPITRRTKFLLLGVAIKQKYLVYELLSPMRSAATFEVVCGRRIRLLHTIYVHYNNFNIFSLLSTQLHTNTISKTMPLNASPSSTR